MNWNLPFTWYNRWPFGLKFRSIRERDECIAISYFIPLPRHIFFFQFFSGLIWWAFFFIFSIFAWKVLSRHLVIIIQWLFLVNVLVACWLIQPENEWNTRIQTHHSPTMSGLILRTKIFGTPLKNTLVHFISNKNLLEFQTVFAFCFFVYNSLIPART